jgi:hypothetical protein
MQLNDLSLQTVATCCALLVHDRHAGNSASSANGRALSAQQADTLRNNIQKFGSMQDKLNQGMQRAHNENRT